MSQEPVVVASPSRTEENGSHIFRQNCSPCHGSAGGGGLGPALAGNRNLASSSYTVARIQLGGGGMPPFARRLSADEIAEVATFVRTAWENRYGAVDRKQVDLQWYGMRRGMRYGVYALEGTEEPPESQRTE